MLPLSEKKKYLRNSLVLLLLLLLACKPAFNPKPRGYHRIQFPEKQYQLYDSACPYSFEYPVYGKIKGYDLDKQHPCWLNIDFPDFNAKIHLTYKTVDKPEDYRQFTEDIRKIAYKHSVKALAINESWINDTSGGNIGMIYDIKGNTASQINFYVTDSTSNFLSGALYFATTPNYDSLAPVISFFRKDIVHLMETLRWK